MGGTNEHKEKGVCGPTVCVSSLSYVKHDFCFFFPQLDMQSWLTNAYNMSKMVLKCPSETLPNRGISKQPAPDEGKLAKGLFNLQTFLLMDLGQKDRVSEEDKAADSYY